MNRYVIGTLALVAVQVLVGDGLGAWAARGLLTGLCFGGAYILGHLAGTREARR